MGKGFRDGVFVGGYPPNTVEDFWAKVDIRDDNECWEWRAGKHTRGYGQFSYRGDNVASHRFAYMLVNGEIPDGLVVRHSCDNPACCNPVHLSVGTQADNVADRHSKGRSARGSRDGEAKLTEDDVLEIIRLLDGGSTQTSLAARYGVVVGTINHISTGRKWGWLTGRKR